MTTELVELHGLSRQLVKFGVLVEGSSDYLLQSGLEEAFNALQAAEHLLSALAAYCDSLTQKILRTAPVTGELLDADDAIINTTERTLSALQSMAQTLMRVESNGVIVTVEERELLAGSFMRCRTVLNRHIEALKALRAAIITFDLASEPRPDKYRDSVEELIGDLHASASE